MKAAIILPTYNERDDIVPLLNELSEVAKRVVGVKFYFVVVDDTSPDGTGQLVKEYSKKHHSVYLVSGKKEGLGRALLRGMDYAVRQLKVEYLVQMDADHSHDPNIIPELFTKVKLGADFVVGSRYIPGGSIPSNWGFHRKIFSVVGNAFVRYGVGISHIHDWTGGFRLHHRRYFETLEHILRPFSGYVFQIAFLHRAVLAGARVVEVPIHFTDRKYGRSKIAPAEYIRNVFRYVIRARLSRTRRGAFPKFLAVGTIGFIINTIVLELLVHGLYIHPGFASAFGAECAIVSNFLLNNAWTFQSKRVYGWKMIPKFLQFNASSLGAILLQALTVTIGTLYFGREDYRIFYVIGVGLGLLWNYLMYSRVIWRQPVHT